MKSYVSPEYRAALGELARDLTVEKRLGCLAVQPELPFPPTLKLRQPPELGWEQTDEASGV